MRKASGGGAAVFDRNVHCVVMVPEGFEAAGQPQDRYWLARERLIKFQMSPRTTG